MMNKLPRPPKYREKHKPPAEIHFLETSFSNKPSLKTYMSKILMLGIVKGSILQATNNTCLSCNTTKMHIYVGTAFVYS
jgi:hypothetical protein